ncbi:MAG: LegC family aminotransferase [Desulfobacterales bacterium]|nr:LegC family aminotransferase [Desulfobacterales bacterium]
MYSDLISFVRDWYQTDQLIPLHEPRFKNVDKEYVADAIDSTFVSSVGEYVTKFEHELGHYLGVNNVVAMVNGTTALQLALKIAGVREGHEVITQPLTFVATANAIVHNNANPVFVDVNKETLGLCPDALSRFLDQNAEKKNGKAFNKETCKLISAIVPMHTFGLPCKIKEIVEIAENWDIPVVEDSAEALGSKVSSQHCGTFGKIGILSFNGNKIITCGGGGAIITNDDKLANRAKHLTTTAKVNHQWDYAHDEIGYNFRMSNLNAALACAQFTQLEGILKDKRELSNSYSLFLKDVEWCDYVKEPEGCTSNYWLNAVITSGKKERDELLRITNDSGITTRPAWQLMSDLKMFKDCQKGELDNAKWLRDRIVNLPSSARNNV